MGVTLYIGVVKGDIMENINQTIPVVYSVREVSRILKTNTGFVYGLIKAGRLPAIRLKSLRVRKEALDKFLQDYEGADLSDLSNVKVLVRT